MKVTWRVVLIVFLTCAGFRTLLMAQAPRTAQEFNRKGLDRQDRGDIDGAVEDFTKAIEASKGIMLVVSYNNRANARMRRRDWAGAIADYTTTIDLQLGKGTQADQKDDSKAESVVIGPPIEMAYLNRGIARQAAGEFDGAIADYNSALEALPRFAEAYYNRAIAFQSKGDSQAAIKDYSTALELSPRFGDAYVNRGQTKQARHDLEGAIADYNAALEINPDDVGVYYARGTAYQEKKDLDAALADYSKVIQLEPSNAQAFANRAVIETLQGKQIEADQDFEQAFKLLPGLKEQYKTFIEGRKVRP